MGVKIYSLHQCIDYKLCWFTCINLLKRKEMNDSLQQLNWKCSWILKEHTTSFYMWGFSSHQESYSACENSCVKSPVAHRGALSSVRKYTKWCHWGFIGLDLETLNFHPKPSRHGCGRLPLKRKKVRKSQALLCFDFDHFCTTCLLPNPHFYFVVYLFGQLKWGCCSSLFQFIVAALKPRGNQST